ncbi:hypothetical protein KY325_00250 [Candidatus Woesearchaeota archaeon]|nr:hypothetical protein [Candidatus Woesearchaeota archaeon]MBW3017577.1 hypothetical protein [Candidatus Woesearchaeota archaeon]
MKKKIEKKERKHGWEPMPATLKVLFVLFIISAASSALSVMSIYMTGYPIFGYLATGYLALVLLLVINTFCIALLAYATWKRYTWTFIYAACLFVFFIANSLLSLTNVAGRVSALSKLIPAGAGMMPSMQSMMYNAIIIGVITGVAINIVFLALMYWKRNYFKK